MSYIKGVIVLAVLALAVGRHVASRQNVEKVCELMMKEVGYEARVGTAKEVLEVANLWPHGLAGKHRKMMIESIEAVLERKECSEASFQYLASMGYCQAFSSLSLISEPSRTYASKCLNAEDINLMIKLAVADTKVDFLSQAFINKFYEENPQHKLSLASRDEGSISRESTSAIIDAMHRDLDRDPKELFSEAELSPALRDYLNQKLYNPCDRYIASVGPFMRKLAYAARLYDDESKELIPKLNQEAKNAIFRFRYCQEAKSDKVDRLSALAHILGGQTLRAGQNS